MLNPYISRSVSSPGAAKESLTASSITTTGPPGRTAARIAASTSTGCGMSWTHSNANAASNPRSPSPAASAWWKLTRSPSPAARAFAVASSIDGGSTSKPSTVASG